MKNLYEKVELFLFATGILVVAIFLYSLTTGRAFAADRSSICTGSDSFLTADQTSGSLEAASRSKAKYCTQFSVPEVTVPVITPQLVRYAQLRTAAARKAWRLIHRH